MTTETNISFDKNSIEALSKKNNEPAWFAELRQSALVSTSELPLPKPDKTKIDSWNFTNFNQHQIDSNRIADFAAIPSEIMALVDTDTDTHNLMIQQNNTMTYCALSSEASEQGVILTGILEALHDYPELVQKYYMTGTSADRIQVDSHKLAALNTALLNGGVFVYVPRNIVVKEPIQVIFAVDHAETSLFNHAIIVAEDFAQCTYVENNISLVASAGTVANLITEVHIGAGAHVTYGAVDTLDKNMTTFVHRTAFVGRDGKIEWALGLMNDGNTISENITLLEGDGSFADTKSVVVGRGVQKQNFTTKVIHTGQQSEGFILKHGVMKDEASAIFNGIGYIKHGATKSNAQQTSRVLMLNKKARGDANPILLIDEDDVVAGHAASVGRVDEMQLYYLMSRGISRQEAERLIIHGFLAPVVNELPVDQVRKQLVDVIEKKVMQ